MPSKFVEREKEREKKRTTSKPEKRKAFAVKQVYINPEVLFFSSYGYSRKRARERVNEAPVNRLVMVQPNGIMRLGFFHKLKAACN